MKEKMTKIVADGQELAEKRTWLIKGYVDLVAAINVELAKIPDMGEADIEFTLKEWTYYSNRQQADLGRKLTVDLKFSNDAYIVMMLGKQEGSYSNGLDWNEVKNPSIENIRFFAGKLAEIFDFYGAEIARRNADNQAAIDIISGLLAKLR